MEGPIEEPNAPLQDTGRLLAGPVRVLVQTVTGLVPGKDYAERIIGMRNLICQHFWKRDFDWDQDRSNVYGGQFAYGDRNCYFLIDHRCNIESPEDPLVLWYKWTGESFNAIEQALPAKIQSKLRHHPFGKRPIRRARSGTPGQYDAATSRQIILTQLRCDMKILDQDVEFLATHPEDARWLKDHVEPRLWLKIQTLLESSQDEDTNGGGALANSSSPGV